MSNPKRATLRHTLSFKRIGQKGKDGVTQKKEMLEQILQTEPVFPGIPLHVCTEDVSLEEIDKVRITFPVHIRNTTLTKAVMSQQQHQELFFSLSIEHGTSETQGKREYMEDRTTVIQSLSQHLKEPFPEDKRLSYYAVFDGHAGSKASTLCQQKLHEVVCSHSEIQKGNIETVLKESLKTFDKFIIEKGTEENWKDGSCASIIVIRDKKLFASNLGDSHMILAKKTPNQSDEIQLRNISQIHKASEESEKKRVQNAGGMVVRNRIYGDLSISRALGDLDYKKPISEEDFVSSDAYTDSLTLTPDHTFALIASDGLWDKITFKEAAEVVTLKRKDMSADEISEHLINISRERDSGDNISVILLLFEWTEKDDKKEVEVEDDKKEVEEESEGTLREESPDNSEISSNTLPESLELNTL